MSRAHVTRWTMVWAVGIVGVLAVGLGGMPLGHSAMAIRSTPPISASSPSGERVSTLGFSPYDAMILTLVPDPARGSAPLSVSVAAMVAGGTAPYQLTVCFGTIDHSSQSPDCAASIHNWSGSGATVFQHEFPSPGSYGVTGLVTDAPGSSVGSSALVVVTNASALDAVATESSQNGAAPLTVQFNGSVVGGTAPFSVQWSFGDGSSGSSVLGVPVAHTYLSEGTFSPTLTVTDAAGHVTQQALPTVHVSAARSTVFGFGDGGGPTVALAVGLFLAATLGVAVTVRVLQVRRWKREGNELVDGISESETPESGSALTPR